jgi:hypothetical protein
MKFNFPYKDSEGDELPLPPAKKKSPVAQTVISNRPQRACKQKIINYHV